MRRMQMDISVKIASGSGFAGKIKKRLLQNYFENKNAT